MRDRYERIAVDAARAPATRTGVSRAASFVSERRPGAANFNPYATCAVHGGGTVLQRFRPSRAKSHALPGLPFPSYLEHPSPDDPTPVHSALVRGIVAVPARAKLKQPVVLAGSARIPTDREERPEVRRGHRNKQLVGFRKFVRLTPELVGTPWELEVCVDDVVYRSPLGVTPSEAILSEFWKVKARKLSRIEPELRCPRLESLQIGSRACGGRLRRDDQHRVCEECGARYAATDAHFDFLDEKLRHLARVEHTENVSSFEYDPFARRIIDRCRDGLVLDAGSGLKVSGYENVVNLEIVDYPTTDVMGIGESLPFADGVFAAALSLAVLEHVRDPFRCAAELARVVRPGGTVYAAVPFLQPYHGYPHHYFNMTLTGLESLFDESFQIEESGTPPYGWPIWTLTWFLNYVDGLPPDTAERFKAMKVGDLLAPGDQYLADDFVLDLGPEARTEIASVNYVIATRR